MREPFYRSCKMWVLLFMAMGAIPALFAQNGLLYRLYQPGYLLAPPAAFENGLLGYVNPANAFFTRPFEMRFFWGNRGNLAENASNWGFFSAGGGFAFGVVRQDDGNRAFYEYTYGFSGGRKSLAYGLAYTTYSGTTPSSLPRHLTMGFILRPNKFVSAGLVAKWGVQSASRAGLVEMAVRPLGKPLFTLFGDLALENPGDLDQALWSVGTALQLASGIHLVGRYFHNKQFTVGLKLDLGVVGGFIGGTRISSSGQSESRFYGIRIGGFQPGIVDSYFQKRSAYTALSLKGRMDYLKYLIFPRDDSPRFMDVLQQIRAAAADPRIRVIAVNLSGMQMTPEMAWEIRTALENAREAGKEIVTYLDYAGLTTYHLASVGDHVLMDPQGSIDMAGVVMGRTYYKHLLEKLGVGFDEWRFFKYKSALEAFSRESMSDADREQRQAYVDDWYETIRADVVRSRGFTESRFDQIVDSLGFVMAREALEVGLVDTLLRWSRLEDYLKDRLKKRLRHLPVKLVEKRQAYNPEWGQPPRIAVVYALGVCDMDTGIRARWLERVFHRLAQDKTVKAVVFRVDSPGGDPMASDVVAEAIRKCQEKKPVVVSQGQVAGSGGYWISMYGDKILAAPNTVTGSIGVIGGWFYDKSFTGKIGLSSDHVQRGKHADLGFGASIPFIGSLPARTLTPEEWRRMETLIKGIYDQFVSKVARGRHMPTQVVRQIAEGRIYSGLDGKEVGLVDEIGGLQDAIRVARRLAKIPDDQRVELVEYPRHKGWFNPDALSPISTNASALSGYEWEFMRKVLLHAGQPLPIMLPGTFPGVDR
ncbi:MAG: signal peptide peptidase SppA [Calditrichaeota bacterium]|nr:signal peptide peptidase SppA [Calditrichota bacterium]